jgi:hypothetical protein
MPRKGRAGDADQAVVPASMRPSIAMPRKDKQDGTRNQACNASMRPRHRDAAEEPSPKVLIQ